MIVSVELIATAARAEDVPPQDAPAIALVGRSNVGKSSLINALARRAIARTSAAPGKTRLINVYRLRRGARPAVCLIDLPGYGYARGGRGDAGGFDALVRGYFARMSGAGPVPGLGNSAPADAVPRQPAPLAGVVLLLDSRHAGLPNDLNAQAWLERLGLPLVLVGTKIDKLSRAERARAQRELEHSFKKPVLPVSAVTGEGLEQLWKLIDRLVNRHRNRASIRGMP